MLAGKSFPCFREKGAIPAFASFIEVLSEGLGFLFPAFDVFTVDNLKSVDSCVSSHFLILLILILV